MLVVVVGSSESEITVITELRFATALRILRIHTFSNLNIDFLLLLLLFFHFLDRFLLNFLASSIHFPLLCFVSFPLLSRPLLGVRPFPANSRRIFSRFFPHCERALKRFSTSFTKIPRRGKRSISYKFLSLFIRVMAFLRCFFLCFEICTIIKYIQLARGCN